MNLSNFSWRQHLIYIVLCLVVGLLIKEGVFLAILIGFVYFKRFPKTYWVYFLISIGCVCYVYWVMESYERKSEEPIFLDEAKVLEVKTQKEKKQTAKIKAEAGLFYLTLATDEPRLQPGDIILVQTKTQPLSHATIPYAFDFKNYLISNGMVGTIFLSETKIIRHEWSIRTYQYQLANWIKENYPSLTATYLQSWLLGMKSDLSEEMNESFSALGILHLFAVSGLHVGLLVGIVSYLLKRLGMIEELAHILLILLVLAFILISGGSASIIRAGGMFVLAKLNRLFKWKLSSLDLLSILFLINFVLFPLQVYQTGFIYSYWLTFCLIICQTFMKKLPAKAVFFVIPCLAQLAVFPIQIFQSYSINVLSYVSNLVLIPVVTTFLMPLLLLTLVIPLLSSITESILCGFEQLIQVMSEYLQLPWIIGSLSLTVICFIILLLFLAGWLAEQQLHLKVWLIPLVAIVSLVEIIRLHQDSSKVTFLDVGQGDSAVIQSPHQRCTTVVDTGGKITFGNETSSIFDQTLKPYLLGEGIRSIDYLILSHGDYDHIGEALPLIQ
ncbi:MAG: ComEC/Rec2 family competence protein [Turicibacter sp.]|nr:ComEC/Rec2 family competence protein [Turicibacter sp.]